MKRQLISSLLLVALVATYAVVFAHGSKTEVGDAGPLVSRGNPSVTTVADGNPPPPFPPKKLRSDFFAVPIQGSTETLLRADGNPPPPFPPKKLKKEFSATDALHQTPGWVMADGNPPPPFPPKKLSKIV
jgi:hypothetical protein